MAIALDGGVPDQGADRLAGSPRLRTFRRDDTSASRQAAFMALPGRSRATALELLADQPAAKTETSAAGQGHETPPPLLDFDARLVKESFACIMPNNLQVMEYFYSHLFAASPEIRAMFPMGMSQVRERVFAALARLVWSMDSPEQFAAYLGQLGRDHRKYGVKDKHYDAFFIALADTVARFCDENWTPETAAAWQGALAYAASMMRMAATADAHNHPPWWVGEIVEHDRRTDTVAVLTIAPDQPLPYRSGQYVQVQVPRWPRVWRPYSIANAPRGDGLITLHVRAVAGGMVSTALVRHASAGDSVLLGPAGGSMTAPDNNRDLICVAGGTGLAPIKAIIEELTRRQGVGTTRKITLFAGAQRRRELYDLPGLRQLQTAHPGLRIIPVLSDAEADGPADEPAVTGLLPDVVRAHGLFEHYEAYVCGPQAMVRQTALLLAAHVPPDQIHHDPLSD